MAHVTDFGTHGLRRRWQEFAEHRDFWLYLASGAAVTLLACFGLLAGALSNQELIALDRSILLALRASHEDPVGSAFLEEFWLEVTNLGGVTVVCLLSLITTGGLLILRRFRVTLILAASLLGGMLLSSGLKDLVGRPRPDVVTHLAAVSSMSFPSGHSMMSAIVYPTLGVILARAATRPLLKTYAIAVALALMALIGFSRVYLGVHYATDVIAGWCVGLSWALVCWIGARLVQRRGPL
jgi:undecaprenyl-diphosphatase